MRYNLSLTIAEINLSNLIHNLNQVRRHLSSSSKKCKILAVVKANAYGHGIREISKELELAGVDMFGVAHVEEGICLRESGIYTGILVMGGISEAYATDIIKWHLTPVVYTIPLAKTLSEAALSTDTVLPVHIKIDTGMRRIGVTPETALEFVEDVAALKGLWIEGIMTHFAEADLQNREFVREQLDSFTSVCKLLERRGITIPLRHTANSAAVIDIRDSHLDMVRPGIMLYGYSPSPFLSSRVDLRPVMTLKSRIIFLKKVPPKTGISYGRIFTTRRETLVATIPIGYADGYSRSLSNTGQVIVRGMRAPVIGRVCMDMTMIDVTDIPGVHTSDEVIVMGGEGDNRITADDIAAWAGTISYEVLCGIGERVERVYGMSNE